jgi:hypothetical protein
VPLTPPPIILTTLNLFFRDSKSFAYGIGESFCAGVAGDGWVGPLSLDDSSTLETGSIR